LYYELCVFQKAVDVFVLLTMVRDLDGDNDDPNGGLYHALAPASEVVTVRTHMCFCSEHPGSGAGSRAAGHAAFRDGTNVDGACCGRRPEVQIVLRVCGSLGVHVLQRRANKGGGVIRRQRPRSYPAGQGQDGVTSPSKVTGKVN
jgi:hypothetical protein